MRSGFLLSLLLLQSACIARSSPRGVVWGTCGGGDEIRALALDRRGNIYAAGSTHNGYSDAMWFKLTPDGRVAWRKEFNNQNSDVAFDIATTADDGVVVVGHTYAPSGSFNLFVTKYSSAGKERWFFTVDAPGEDTARAVAVASDGSIWVTGTFRGTLRLGADTLETDGSMNLFVIRLSPDGEAMSAVQMAPTAASDLSVMSIDARGQLLYVGTSFAIGYAGGSSPAWTATRADALGGKRSYIGSVPVADGTIVTGQETGALLSTTDVGGLFLSKLDRSGHEQWVTRLPVVGKGDPGYGRQVTTDAAGNIWVVGSIGAHGPMQFGRKVMRPRARRDALVAKFSPSGQPIWAEHFGKSDDIKGKALAIDPRGDVIVGMEVTGEIELGPTTWGGRTLPFGVDHGSCIAKVRPPRP